MAWVPGEELLKRIWETVERAGTGLMSPWQIRREGKARADVRRLEALSDAQTRLEVERVLSGSATLDDRGKLLSSSEKPLALPMHRTLDAAAHLRENADAADAAIAVVEQKEATANPEKVSDTTQAWMKYSAIMEELRSTERLLNLREVVSATENLADREAEGESTSSARPTPDWFDRWREGAETVSDKDLQQLWAKLLLGEVKAPGAFSLRLIAFLRTLSQSDAQVFERVAALTIDGNFIYRGEPLDDYKALEDYGVKFLDIAHLDDIGLLSGVQSLGLSRKFVFSDKLDSYAMRFHGDIALVLTRQDKSKPLTVQLNGLPLTSIGRELVKLGVFQTPERYITAVSDTLTHQGLQVRRGKIIGTKDDQVTVKFDDAQFYNASYKFT